MQISSLAFAAYVFPAAPKYIPSSLQLHTLFAMSSKNEVDIEVQARDSLDSKEICEQTKTLTDDWDAPDNKENPRNWTACELCAIVFMFCE